jgi:hypothetical protein
VPRHSRGAWDRSWSIRVPPGMRSLRQRLWGQRVRRSPANLPGVSRRCAGDSVLDLSHSGPTRGCSRQRFAPRQKPQPLGRRGEVPLPRSPGATHASCVMGARSPFGGHVPGTCPTRAHEFSQLVAIPSRISTSRGPYRLVRFVLSPNGLIRTRMRLPLGLDSSRP